VVTCQIAALHNTTRLFPLTALRNLIELIRFLHTFEIPPPYYVRQWRQFPLPRRIPCTTAVVTCQHAAPYTPTRLFALTSLRNLIELIRSLHTFEILPPPYVRQRRQFPLPRRILWTTAVGMWSHVKTRLRTPRHDFHVDLTQKTDRIN